MQAHYIISFDGFFLGALLWMALLFAPAHIRDGSFWLLPYWITWTFIIGTFVLQIVLSISQVAMSKENKRMRRMAPTIFFGFTIGVAILFLVNAVLDDLSLSVHTVILAVSMVFFGNIYTVLLLIVGRFIRWICGIVKGRLNRE